MDSDSWWWGAEWIESILNHDLEEIDSISLQLHDMTYHAATYLTISNIQLACDVINGDTVTFEANQKPINGAHKSWRGHRVCLAWAE